MTNKIISLGGVLLLAVLTVACPKGGDDFKKGRQAELRKDYDTALIHYERALKVDPGNTLYELRMQRARFEAAQMHVDRGNKLFEQGLLEPAVAEYRKAVAIDPGSFIAEQQLRRIQTLLGEQRRAQARAAEPEPSETLQALAGLPSAPPQLRPVSREPLNLRMNEDTKRIFESIGELAGINVVFDPDLQPRRIQIELSDSTVEEALDIVALMTKTFWKAVTPNTIMVIPDNNAKRAAHEDQIIKTFYLSNITNPAELTELVQALRTLLDLKRIAPNTVNNAIVIRDTPDKVAVAEKIIHDVDRAKPEVLIQVTVLQARRDRARELGILPSTSVPLLFTPRSSVSPENGGDGAIRLNDLGNLSGRDYSLVLPSFTAMALLTDSTTKIIQNPQIRTTDGQKASLRIGDKVPFAVGSFSSGIGGGGVNPLVNTQFQFQDVGVNLDVTPRVHSNREITLSVTVEISSVTGQVNIGGIQQPIFGQRKIEHEIRLKEGEVSILGGIIERTEEVSLTGWPGLAKIPFLRYFFSSETKTERESEILIVLMPRIIRLPKITELNRRALAIGTQNQLSLPHPARSGAPAEKQPLAQIPEPDVTPEQPEEPVPAAPEEPEKAAQPAQLGFEPAQTRIKVGEQAAVNVLVRNVQDLYRIPFVVSFDPKLVKLTGVRHGGFMGGEELPPALVHRTDELLGRAIISISRPPDASGISGEGILVTLFFEGLASGQVTLTVPQILARDSQNQILEIETQSAILIIE